jgi:long-chain acyl-CoA synthetase
MSFNLATMLRESRMAGPERPCLLADGATLSYREVDERSTDVARGLRALGLGHGDVLALALPNLPEFVIAYFGALKAGVIVMPLSPLLTRAELAYLLADSGARHLIGYEPFVGELLAASRRVPGVTVYTVPAVGTKSTSCATPAKQAKPFASLFQAPRAGAGAEEMRGDIEPTRACDNAVLLYTSGMTGRPKAVELTHFQLYMNCTICGELFGVRSDDVVLGVLPLFHVFGLSSVLNACVRYGTAVSLAREFTPRAVLELLAADRVSVILGVPAMYAALLAADRSGLDLSRLRGAISGGASLPAETLRAFEAAFGVALLEGYGLSETSCTATFNPSAQDRRVLSVGRPIWGVEARVVDPEDRPLPAGPDHVGEIVLRGHNVIERYRGRPPDTEDVFRNGWFHTGDLGYLDADGYLFIVDRAHDLVVRGGYQVYSREVEEVLYAHPAVAEAAVIGRPDERLGEEIVAVVSLRAGSEATPSEIIEFCRQRMAAYKYPREVRVLDALPKNATGVIVKKLLREA